MDNTRLRLYSNSRIKQRLDGCGYYYYRDRVMGERKWGGSAATWIGTTFHKVGEIWLNRMIKDKAKAPTVEECQETADEVMLDNSAHTLNISEKEADEAVVRARHMASGAAEVLATMNDPQHAEVHLNATFEYNEHPYELYGIVDAVDIDPVTGQHRARDFKTGKSFMQSRYENDTQMAMYTTLMSANGMPTDQARIDHVRYLKTRGAVYTPLDLVCGDSHRRRLGALLEQVRIADEAGVFLPNPMSQWCNDRCPYWGDCEYRKPD